MRPVEEAMRESMQKMAKACRSMKNILVTGGLGLSDPILSVFL